MGTLHLRWLGPFLATTLAIACVGAAGQTAAAHPTVKWFFNSFPPYQITAGADAGQGAFDRVQRALAQRMPQYRHEREEGALPRLLQTVRDEPNVCTVSLLKTPERAELMDFSLPHSQLLPNGIVLLRSRLPEMAPYLNADGELKLDEWLASGRFRLALAPTRSYGAALDALLRRHAARIVPVASSDVFVSRLLKLTHQHEFDAMVGYAVELRYAVRAEHLDPQAYAVLPVAPTAGLLPVSVACSKSRFGREVLDAVNRLLSEPGLRRELAGYYREWLDPGSAAYYDRLQSGGALR